MYMENKCKNCMHYHSALWHSDGTKGTCGETGVLVVKDREEKCDCMKFMEIPKQEKIKRTIEKVLSAWVRERDERFKMSMSWVYEIKERFHQGEFKVLDAVKATVDMKRLIYGTKNQFKFNYVWTYHCPWDVEEMKEHFIALTCDNKMYYNIWHEKQQKFIMTEYDIEDEFQECMDSIDKIRANCIMGMMVSEVEDNKSIQDVTEIR